MQIFHHINSLRDALAEHRQQGQTLGFVPTMGNLHRGHLELIALAKAQADITVASIFVNRLQFGLNEDWDKYPRTLTEDGYKLREAQCDYLFCPDESEMYPNGMDQQARVVVPSMSGILCGASRPGHFDGVTTVVSKLFNIVQPDLAVFGLKDYQQLAIIRRMVQDLCIPVRLVDGPIVREADGLAMSSRNRFITPEERPQAIQLNRSLNWVREQIEGGKRDFTNLEQAARMQIKRAGFRPDYISVCESRTLNPAAHDDQEIIVLGAMYCQAARLIDNVPVTQGEQSQVVWSAA